MALFNVLIVESRIYERDTVIEAEDEDEARREAERLLEDDEFCELVSASSSYYGTEFAVAETCTYEIEG